MEKLKKNLDKAIQDYVDRFCDKYDFQFFGWISNDTGTIGLFNDYYFDFEVVRLDLENDIPKRLLIEWYDLTIELHYAGKNTINYKSFLMSNNEQENKKKRC